MRSLLKWPGGKRWLAPRLRQSYLNCGSPRLVEPFAGSLAVSFTFRPRQALLNDINPHLINLYQKIKDGSLLKLETMPSEEKDYYFYREEFNQRIKKDEVSSVRTAQLFYYLNRYGFNGLCRFNTDGEFNVPFGQMKSTQTVRDLSHFHIMFQSWDFSCGDFSGLEIQPNDYLYLDPPYDSTFTNYSEEGFSWKDQERLALWANHHLGPVVVSNSRTDRVLSLYQSLGFEIHFVSAPRSISRDADGRGKTSEILATKNIEVEINEFESNVLF